MDLTKTPFNVDFLRRKNELVTFIEAGVQLTMLSPIGYEISSGHRYMFGVIEENKYYWLFNGKSIADSRETMRSMFYEIQKELLDKNQVLFAYKGNLYGSRI